MKLIPFIWAGLWRKPARTLLSLLCLAVGFLLFGLLRGVDSAFDAALERQRIDRLLVDSRYGDPPMPRNYMEQILRVPGVTDLVWTQFLIGRWGGPKDNLVVVASDTERFFRVRNEFSATPEHVAALRQTRSGLLVYEPIAQKNGWKVGDRITLTSAVALNDGSHQWSFVIVGFLTNPDSTSRVSFALGNYDYFDEARGVGRGTVGRFVVRIADPTRSAEIAAAIDDRFESSGAPTRTTTENEAAHAQLAGVGDVRLLTRAIISAVFFAILFLTGSALVHSVRERTSEFAALRALGFRKYHVIAVVVLEALFVCIGAAALGLSSSAVAFPLVSRYLPRLSAYVGVPSLSWQVFTSGLLLAILVTALSAALPGWLSIRPKIAQALTARNGAQ